MEKTSIWSDRGPSRDVHDQADDKQHQENHEQDLCDAGRRERHKSETKCTSYQCNYKENQCVVEHSAPFRRKVNPAVGS